MAVGVAVQRITRLLALWVLRDTHWRKAASVIAVVSVLAAGPLYSGVAAASGSKPKNVVVLSTAEVQPALFVLTDMPTGYAATSNPNATPSGTSGFCNGPNEAARAQAQGVTGSGSVEFAQNPDFGPFLSENVYSFPSVQTASAMLSSERSQVACGMYNSVNDGVSLSESIAPIAFAKAGDDLVAFRLTSTTTGTGSSPTTASEDQITVRLANNVITVGYGGIGGPNAATEQQYVGTAISKLGVAIAAAKNSRRPRGSRRRRRADGTPIFAESRGHVGAT